MAIKYKYGIDFGTTNSSIALRYDAEGKGIVTNNLFRVDSESKEEVLLPTSIYVDADGNESAGTMAQSDYTDDEVDIEKRLIPKIKLLLDEEKKDSMVAKVGIKEYYISDLIAIVLKKLKQKADRDHFVDISGMIFGVPVDYDDNCKMVMLKACYKAGFYSTMDEVVENVEFVSEPVAVALDYGVDLQREKTIFVFDFGGGTCDSTIVQLKAQKNGTPKYPHDVLYKSRITLGGERFTELFFKNAFLTKFGKERFAKEFMYPEDISVDDLWLALREDQLGVVFIRELDDAKKKLSIDDEIRFTFDRPDYKRSPHIRVTLTREDFESAIAVTFEEIEQVIAETFSGAQMRAEDIQEVLLAGGSSLIPAIKELVCKHFERSIVRDPSNNALFSIVKGLAVAGYKEEGNLYSDVVDSDYGIYDGGRKRVSVIVSRGTKVEETQFDKVSVSGGRSRLYATFNDVSPVLKIFQNDSQIGTIALPYAGTNQQFRIFFNIDVKKGWLNVFVYDIDKEIWYNDLYENSEEYQIKIEKQDA